MSAPVYNSNVHIHILNMENCSSAAYAMSSTDTTLYFKTAYLMSSTDATLPVFFRYIFHWGFNTLQMEHRWTGLAAQ